jgi:hypothetical protein
MRGVAVPFYAGQKKEESGRVEKKEAKRMLSTLARDETRINVCRAHGEGRGNGEGRCDAAWRICWQAARLRLVWMTSLRTGAGYLWRCFSGDYGYCKVQTTRLDDIKMLYLVDSRLF